MVGPAVGEPVVGMRFTDRLFLPRSLDAFPDARAVVIVLVGMTFIAFAAPRLLPKRDAMVDFLAARFICVNFGSAIKCSNESMKEAAARAVSSGC